MLNGPTVRMELENGTKKKTNFGYRALKPKPWTLDLGFRVEGGGYEDGPLQT